MSKIQVSFEQFKAATAPLGISATKQSDSIFFVKYKLAGKVELNCHSGTYTVGSGSKYLAEVTQAVQAAGYEVAKANRGWTVLKATGKDHAEILADFTKLIEVVGWAVPATAAKAPKAVKRATSLTVKAVSKADLAAIREKNLATIKAVADKFKAA